MISLGQEWLLTVEKASPQALRDPSALQSLMEALVSRLELHIAAAPLWHVFPEPGGITGLYLLSESHAAIHTFPEFQAATLSVYSCRSRADFPFETLLADFFPGAQVSVQRIDRKAFS